MGNELLISAHCTAGKDSSAVKSGIACQVQENSKSNWFEDSAPKKRTRLCLDKLKFHRMRAEHLSDKRLVIVHFDFIPKQSGLQRKRGQTGACSPTLKGQEGCSLPAGQARAAFNFYYFFSSNNIFAII